MQIYKVMKGFFFLLFLLIGLSSCNEREIIDSNAVEQELTLDKETAELFPGDRIVLNPRFDIEGNKHRTYYWSTDNASLVDVAQHDDLSATVVAKRLGEATVTLRSTDGTLEASCEIHIVKSETGGITRMLIIGNGFSEDAVESYLYDLAKQGNQKIEVGDLYLKDATLQMHSENTDEEEKVYQLRKIDQFGNKTNTSKISLKEAVSMDDWDYIGFQQEVALSGLSDSYIPYFSTLFDYVKNAATNPDVKFVFHQTWAYEQSSGDPGFDNYQRNQLDMYTAIVDAVSNATDLVPVDFIVPVGTAIQNARTSFIGDNLCRDGAHLNEIGKYIASATWFEILFNKSVIGNRFIPKEISGYEAEIAQHAVHLAITTPDAVTEMTDYQSAGFLKKSVFMGFGSESVPDGWNAFLSNNNYNAGARIDNLVDEDEGKTGISIEITESFNERNANGVAEVATDFAIPAAVSKYSYYGNAKGGAFNGKIVRQSAFKISNLNKDQVLNLCFFSSRDGVSDNRETKFIIQGQNTVTVYLDATNNASNTTCATGVKPDSKGEINVTLTMGESNNNANGFYYINALRIYPAN